MWALQKSKYLHCNWVSTSATFVYCFCRRPDGFACAALEGGRIDYSCCSVEGPRGGDTCVATCVRVQGRVPRLYEPEVG